MKKVVVRFVSVFAEKLGKERVVEVDDSTTIEELINVLSKELEEVKTKSVIFVNYKFPKENQPLNDGDVILVMPLFAGGRKS